jgi:hypothetical protein
MNIQITGRGCVVYALIVGFLFLLLILGTAIQTGS